VTGASSGMGYATAATLARADAAVVINARRRERLEKPGTEVTFSTI
jgi:NADP-dependent 3-hydroxy acid dehydrogenase YdfG